MSMAQQPIQADTALEVEVGEVFGWGDSTPASEPPAPAPAASAEGGEAVGSAPAASPQPAAEPTPQQSAQPEPATGEQQPAAPQPTPEPAPTPPVADERALREASLAAQVDALQRQLEEMRANSAGQQPGQAAQTASPNVQPSSDESGVPIRRYNLSLPQQVVDALSSDDPQQTVAAITTIVNDLGTIIHNAAVAEMRAEMQKAIGAVQSSTAESTQEAEVARMQEQYYKTFAAHKNPLVLPLLQAEASKMALEFPGAAWDDNYIATLGARVNASIAALSGGTAQPQAAPQPATPAPRPAAMLPSGARPNAAPGGEDLNSPEFIGNMFSV